MLPGESNTAQFHLANVSRQAVVSTKANADRIAKNVPMWRLGRDREEARFATSARACASWGIASVST